jgi:stearoyl-CoA desaturase (delta-9 desaturase)
MAVPELRPPPRRLSRSQIRWRDYEWGSMSLFFAIHVGGIVGVILGAPWPVWVACIALYWIRMFAITAGYHRYFSHRSFKTSRWFQFLLAFVAQTSSQRGVLWWAAHHRAHHQYSDTEYDIHSPHRTGFFFSHIGWIYYGNSDTDWSRVRDLARYPELVWLNRWWFVPPLVLALAMFLWQGWPGVLVGFMFSTVLTWHATFTVNSLTHLWGRRRYATSDDSRNNLWIALLTMGEGWHNNHHHYMSSARQGFYWWEIDVTYYLLRLLERMGLVRDLRPPPERVYSRSDPSRLDRAA